MVWRPRVTADSDAATPPPSGCSSAVQCRSAGSAPHWASRVRRRAKVAGGLERRGFAILARDEIDTRQINVILTPDGGLRGAIGDRETQPRRDQECTPSRPGGRRHSPARRACRRPHSASRGAPGATVALRKSVVPGRPRLITSPPARPTPRRDGMGGGCPRATRHRRPRADRVVRKMRWR